MSHDLYRKNGDLEMTFEDFCGSPLWDEQYTWNSTNPDFTDCFHKTVLVWIPVGFLLLFAPFEFLSYRKSASRKIPWTFLNLVKLSSTLACIVISLVDLILVISSNDDFYDVAYVSPVILIVGFGTSLFLLLSSLHFGVQTSPSQFFFYFLSVLCGGFTLRSVIKRQYEEDFYHVDDPTRVDDVSIMFGIQYACVLMLFIANLFSDAIPTQYDPRYAKLENPCPKISSSFFNQLTFEWATPLLWKGWRRPLEQQDMWQVDPKLTSRGIVPVFDDNFHRGSKKKGYDSLQANQVSLFPALFYTFGPMFFVGSIMKIIADLFQLLSPQIMKFMISYVESYAEDDGNHEFKWKGYFYAFMLLIIMILQSIFNAQYSEKMYSVSMNLRTAVTSAIYRKSLKMSGAAKRVSTVGEIVNLMAVDIQRFMDLVPYLNMLW